MIEVVKKLEIRWKQLLFLQQQLDEAKTYALLEDIEGITSRGWMEQKELWNNFLQAWIESGILTEDQKNQIKILEEKAEKIWEGCKKEILELEKEFNNLLTRGENSEQLKELLGRLQFFYGKLAEESRSINKNFDSNIPHVRALLQQKIEDAEKLHQLTKERIFSSSFKISVFVLAQP